MKPRRNDRQGMLTHYLKTLMGYAGIRAWLSLALIVFLGLSQGVGLVMLVPFLGLIGLGAGKTRTAFQPISAICSTGSVCR